MSSTREAPIIESIAAVVASISNRPMVSQQLQTMISPVAKGSITSSIDCIVDIVKLERSNDSVSMEYSADISLQLQDCIGQLARIVESTESFQIATVSAINSSIGKGILSSVEDVVSSIPKRTNSILGNNPLGSVLRSSRRHADENLHSDLLASALNADIAGTFAITLFNEIIKEVYSNSQRSFAPAYQFSKREVQLQSIDTIEDDSGLRRIDILVHRPSEVMVIENKIWSNESEGQTIDYAAAIARGYGSRRQFCIFLSPYGSSGISGHFKGLSYLQLYECFERSLKISPDSKSRVPEFYFYELADIVNDFYR